MKDVIFVHLLLIFCDEISQLCNQFIFLDIDRSCSFIVNYKVLIDMLFGNTKQCIKCIIKVIICLAICLRKEVLTYFIWKLNVNSIYHRFVIVYINFQKYKRSYPVKLIVLLVLPLLLIFNLSYNLVARMNQCKLKFPWIKMSFGCYFIVNFDIDNFG